MSRWALKLFCRSVTCFLLIAPIFFVESHTFVGISSPPVFFWQICEFVKSVFFRDIRVPNYLAVYPLGIWFPFNVIVGQFSLFKLKVT
jgi:hypothetical protein